MARVKKQAAAITTDESTLASDGPIGRLKMGESGYLGLRISNKQILEERRTELRWPLANLTYKLMAEDATIISALSLFEMMCSRVEWDIDIPENASPELTKRAEFIEECFDDMEHSFYSFIKEVCSVFTYGYCVNEKVYRRRYTANGSKYNDGYVGLRKLPVRSQDTLSGWLWSDDGRDLLGVQQDIMLFADAYRYTKLSKENGTKINIPRNKFLLFRTDAKRDNPEGRSPLKGCYVAWKYRMELEEQEAINLVRGLGGIPVLRMASRYMSADATPDEAAIYQHYKDIIRRLNSNEQSGIIIPSEFDPDTKQPLFDFELLGINGNQHLDSSAVISRWDNKMLMSLFADLLKMGQEHLGSMALATSKTSIMAMAVEARLKEIADVINQDLIPDIFARNGWNAEELPKICFGDVNEFDLDVFSSAVQRIFAVGAVEYRQDVMNVVRDKAFKLPPLDGEVDMTKIPAAQSRSGDSMASGKSGNGTSDKPAGRDNSTANKA